MSVYLHSYLYVSTMSTFNLIVDLCLCQNVTNVNNKVRQMFLILIFLIEINF